MSHRVGWGEGTIRKLNYDPRQCLLSRDLIKSMTVAQLAVLMR